MSHRPARKWGPLAYLLAVLMTDSGCHYRPLQGLGFHQGIPVKLFLSRLVQHSACEFRRQLSQRLTLALLFFVHSFGRPSHRKLTSRRRGAVPFWKVKAKALDQVPACRVNVWRLPPVNNKLIKNM